MFPLKNILKSLFNIFVFVDNKLLKYRFRYIHVNCSDLTIPPDFVSEILHTYYTRKDDIECYFNRLNVNKGDT